MLNKKAVAVKEGDEEKIVMGGGIGFEKGKNEVVGVEKIEKMFVVGEENEKLKQIVGRLGEGDIEVGEDMMSYVEGKV
ncbi:CAT RNA binding domain-containing protein, partial [Bacillus sp. WP8]|uniref:CAT RNA binding domain-containing protein n=1 Tax=Bacillus sp. WP8 TaxID=756828 RepID=UPI0028D05BBF